MSDRYPSDMFSRPSSFARSRGGCLSQLETVTPLGTDVLKVSHMSLAGRRAIYRSDMVVQALSSFAPAMCGVPTVTQLQVSLHMAICHCDRDATARLMQLYEEIVLCAVALALFTAPGSIDHVCHRGFIS